MLKNDEIVVLLNEIRENKLEALDKMHTAFKPFLNKYCNKFQVDFDILQSEFNYILFNIIEKNIQNPQKIVSYIKASFYHFKNDNIDKLIRNHKEIIFVPIEEHQEYLKTKSTVESEIFPKENKELLNIDAKILECMMQKYVDKIKGEEIKKWANCSRQNLYKRIKKEKDKILLNINSK